jgi:hypothetical protein
MEPRRRSDPGFGSGPPRYPGTFLLAFREALATLNWQAQRWLGGAVECLDADGGKRLIGLENLYRRIRGTERSTWPTFITEFLQAALGPTTDAPVPTDLNAVAEQVLVRLGPPLAAQPDEAEVWARPLADTDLVLNLVIDFPDRMIYVTEAMVESSGRAGDDWLNTALSNLRGRTEAAPFQVIHEESGLRMCNVADAYDSSRVLLLDELLPEGKPFGWFVSLPSRDQLLVLPVDRHALVFVHLMKVLSDRNYKSAPYAISPEIFWLHEGQWLPFRIDIEGERVVLEPPKEFSAVMEELMPDDEDEEIEADE